MRRIDDFLLIKELNARLFENAISENLLHVAVSAPSSCIEYDYERLELLGESIAHRLVQETFVTVVLNSCGRRRLIFEVFVHNICLRDESVTE